MKYEEVYLHEFADGWEAEELLSAFFRFNLCEGIHRPHTMAFYFSRLSFSEFVVPFAFFRCGWFGLFERCEPCSVGASAPTFAVITGNAVTTFPMLSLSSISRWLAAGFVLGEVGASTALYEFEGWA